MVEIDFNSLKIELGEELLPIGTVLLVQGIKQPVMVYGRKQLQGDTEKVWDYVACPYPQGHLGEDTNVFFSHSQIQEVVFKGFESEGEKAIRKQLTSLFSGKE
ncbi:DUF4176 domain-containing protein [Mesobacillus zeae]|uniref:DUF4176 domain-containing protein n=1 Tax=Mesobacillus zeae TaxID=1917180 RepID=A0A398BA53_9BACI|nr:DUF4176 domain-containing protein [Mesobacillus zeae]RID86742.1 DUF4176 domain-containing protein [Mesobacillus zeae]